MADTRSETRKRFDTEFAAARKRGDKTFDFDGKSIAVKLKEDSAETPKKPSMAAQGLTAKGEPAPLRNIPILPNKVEKQNLDEKGRIGNAIMRAEVEEAEANPRKVSTKESLSPGEETMKRGGKVKSSASKRADGIAQKGHTKGRYI